MGPDSSDADRLAAIALAEDGPVDLTSELAVPAGTRATGLIQFRSGGVLAGRPYADAVARGCGLPPIQWGARDGDSAPPGAVVGRIQGPLQPLLRAERPLLNFLQRGCGIATATRAYADAVSGTSCRILHTRKTAPGLRHFDVQAVLAGGGMTHRLDLGHAMLVKDNHWHALERSGGRLHGVVERARARGISACYVEVESLDQVREACAAGASRLLIDNQSPGIVGSWTAIAKDLVPGIEVEASGGITLDDVRAYAEAGADFVSIGGLTHSVRAADLSLEVENVAW